MSNIKLTFYGTKQSKTNNICLECLVNERNEVFIDLKDKNNNPLHRICLDVSTAIKFAKTLRTKINEAKEVKNG